MRGDIKRGVRCITLNQAKSIRWDTPTSKLHYNGLKKIVPPFKVCNSSNFYGNPALDPTKNNCLQKMRKTGFVSFWKYRFGFLDPAWKFLHPKGWHLLEWDKVSAFASFGHAFGHNQAEPCPDQLDREIPNCPLLRFQIPYLWRLISYIWTWYIFQFIKSGAIEKNVKMSIQTVFWSVGSDGEDE